jgi:hypothetical protein
MIEQHRRKWAGAGGFPEIGFEVKLTTANLNNLRRSGLRVRR